MRNIKTRQNKKKQKRARMNKSSNFHLISFKKGMKFLKTKFKVSKKLIIKKLTPSFYLKKHIKKSGSNNRRKMIPEHSLSKITPAHKRKKPEKIEYKKKIGD